MSKQRSSGPHRRILARLCALALIAVILLTSAYAGGALESGLAVESLATENLAAENPAAQNLAQQNTVPAEGTAATLAPASTNATEEPPTAAPSAPTSAQAATQSTAAPSQPATQAPNRAPQAAASLAEEPLYTLVLGADEKSVTAFYPNENTDQSTNAQWGVAGLYYDAQHNAHVLLVHNINNPSSGESKLGTFSVNNQAFDKNKYSYTLTSTPFDMILFQDAAGVTLETLAPKLNNKAPLGYFDVNVGNIQIGESFTVGLETGSPGWNIEGLQVDLDLSYTLTKTVAKGTSAAEGVAFTESVSVERGDWVIYKITVKNTGKLPLQDMILTDLLPQDVFVEGSVQMGVGEADGSIPNWQPFPAEGILFADYSSPGQFTRDIYIKAQVKPDLAIDTATEYVNTAKIDGMAMPTLEDTAKITVNPPKKGMLRVSKAVTSENPMDPAPDTEFHFTLTYGEETENFSLKNGGSREFEIPANAAFNVTETAAAGYTTKVNSTPGASFTGTMPENGALVAAFENQFSARTISLNIKKVDENTKSPLDGARFELREAVVNGDTWSDQEQGKTYYPDGVEDFLTGSDGKATFNDIPFGNYLLYETKAPAGYKLPKDPVRVTVEAGMVTLIIDGQTILIPTPSGEGETSADATIPNKEQDDLPVAGGMGAIWFPASGLALMSAAAVLYGKRRRKGEKE